MQTLWLLAGVALAVALLIWLSMRLGFRGVPVLVDRDEAIAIAAEAISGGFGAVEAAIDRQGHGALLRDKDGRLAVILPHGAHFIARLVDVDSIDVGDGSKVTVRIPGRTSSLDLGKEAQAWRSALARPL